MNKEQKIKIINKALKGLSQQEAYDLIKECKEKFGGYAISQIKKARGLNKKIVKEVGKEKKTPLDFCYVPDEHGQSIHLKNWLDRRSLDPKFCGLSSLNHIKNGFAVFYDYFQVYGFRGICFDDSNAVHLSSIPIGIESLCTTYYDADSYSRYCIEYKEYWDWVETRNPVRFNTNMEHGKGYDSKNLMHCIRLLETAIDIAEKGEVVVKRPNREFLLSIKRGDMAYDDIISFANEKKLQMEEAFDKSTLREKVDQNLIDKMILDIRYERWTRNILKNP